MFYRYCSRRGTDVRLGVGDTYIARAFCRLQEDLWISVCLSSPLPCHFPRRRLVILPPGRSANAKGGGGHRNGRSEGKMWRKKGERERGTTSESRVLFSRVPSIFLLFFERTRELRNSRCSGAIENTARGREVTTQCSRLQNGEKGRKRANELRVSVELAKHFLMATGDANETRVSGQRRRRA